MSVMNIRGIPQDLAAEFKALCARKNRSMTHVIIAFIRYAVEKQRIPGDVQNH